MTPQVWQRIRDDWRRSLPAVLAGKDFAYYPDNWAQDGGGETPEITMADVVNAVCRVFEITEDALMSQTRLRAVAWPRQLAMKILHDLGWSLPFIGTVFKRDHTTVLHACRAIDRNMADPAYSERAGRVMAALGR